MALSLEEEETKSIDTNKVINLNVGGVKYMTTIQTLIGYDSILKVRFSGKYAIKSQEDGSYFIDRDGELFRFILEYFRTGQLMLPSGWEDSDIWRFYLEVKYFMVKSLFDTVLCKMFKSELIIKQRNKQLIFSKIAEIMEPQRFHLEMVKDMGLLYKYDLSQTKIDKNSKLNEIQMERVRESFSGCTHSLLLIECNNDIHGVYFTRNPFVSGSELEDTKVIYDKSFSIRTEWSYNATRLVKVLLFEDVETVFHLDEKFRYDYDDETPFNPYPIRSFPFESRRYGEFDANIGGVWRIITKIELWSIPAPL